jgi:hypothetical protein
MTQTSSYVMIARVSRLQGKVQTQHVAIPPSAPTAASHAAYYPRTASLEVYVKCDLEVARRRDPKGLYARTLAGEIKEFTGVYLALRGARGAGAGGRERPGERRGCGGGDYGGAGGSWDIGKLTVGQING